MPQSFDRILLHITFSTKDRKPTITPALRQDLHAYLATVCRDKGSHAYRVGGTADHVHLLASLSRTNTTAQLLSAIKANSSKWMKRQGAPGFSWQQGYGAFSVGPADMEAVITYIDNQEDHHQKLTFKDELLRFLHKYGIDYDERYMWD